MTQSLTGQQKRRVPIYTCFSAVGCLLTNADESRLPVMLNVGGLSRRRSSEISKSHLEYMNTIRHHLKGSIGPCTSDSSTQYLPPVGR